MWHQQNPGGSIAQLHHSMLWQSRRCTEPAPQQQENPEIGSGVSGQNPRDAVVAVGSRGFQVFMSESAAKKLEIYVSQVKTIGCYQNKES